MDTTVINRRIKVERIDDEITEEETCESPVSIIGSVSNIKVEKEKRVEEKKKFPPRKFPLKKSAIKLHTISNETTNPVAIYTIRSIKQKESDGNKKIVQKKFPFQRSSIKLTTSNENCEAPKIPCTVTNIKVEKEKETVECNRIPELQVSSNQSTLEEPEKIIRETSKNIATVTNIKVEKEKTKVDDIQKVPKNKPPLKKSALKKATKAKNRESTWNKIDRKRNGEIKLSHYTTGQLLLLLEDPQFGCNPENVDKLMKRLRLKTSTDQKSIIDYINSKAKLGETSTPYDINTEQFLSLNKWVEMLRERRVHENCADETSKIFRNIAQTEKHPDPEFVEDVNFKQLYSSVADLMDGRPICGLSETSQIYLEATVKEIFDEIHGEINDDILNRIQDTILESNLIKYGTSEITATDHLQKLFHDSSINPFEFPLHLILSDT